MGNITCKDLCDETYTLSLCDKQYYLSNSCMECILKNFYINTDIDPELFDKEFKEKKMDNLLNISSKINNNYISREPVVSVR